MAFALVGAGGEGGTLSVRRGDKQRGERRRNGFG